MMLSEVGVDIAPIIASAGIIGIALGFGAQSLVKDFLSGVFMILEDQFGVGDIIDIGEATGTVEAVSLRVTRLRDINGTVWYVPNGEIMRVGNQSQNWSRTVLDVGVAYSEDLARVQPGAGGGRPRHVGGRGPQGPGHRGAVGLGRAGARRRRRHDARRAQDHPRRPVGRRARDASSASRPASTSRASRSPSPSGSCGTARRRPSSPKPRPTTDRGCRPGHRHRAGLRLSQARRRRPG